MEPSWTSTRATLAAIKRHRPDDLDAIQDAERNHRAARLAAHIERTVAAMPGPDAEQRCRLAVLLLTPTATAHGGAKC